MLKGVARGAALSRAPNTTSLVTTVHWSSLLLFSYNPINFEAHVLMKILLYKKRVSLDNIVELLFRDNNESIGVFEEDYTTRVRAKRDRIDN